MSKRKRRQLVVVRWLDSWNMGSGWHDLGKVRDQADWMPKQRTAGYVVVETKRTLVVASSLNATNDGAAIIAIPKVAIVKRRRPR